MQKSLTTALHAGLPKKLQVGRERKRRVRCEEGRRVSHSRSRIGCRNAQRSFGASQSLATSSESISVSRISARPLLHSRFPTRQPQCSLHSDCHRWIHENFRCLKNERLDKVWSVILNTFKYGRAKPCKKRKASRRFFKDYIPRRVVRGNTKQRRPQPA